MNVIQKFSCEDNTFEVVVKTCTFQYNNKSLTQASRHMVPSAVGPWLASLPIPTQAVLKGISHNHVAFKIMVEANEQMFQVSVLKLSS